MDQTDKQRLRQAKARKGDGGVWVLEAQQAARILTFLSMMGVNSLLHLTLLGRKRVRHCQTARCRGLLVRWREMQCPGGLDVKVTAPREGPGLSAHARSNAAWET